MNSRLPLYTRIVLAVLGSLISLSGIQSVWASSQAAQPAAQESHLSLSVDNTSWYMAGANPQRTSWVAEEVNPSRSSNFGVEWYRPIEAYIGQHVQLVAARDKIYVASARGLYALAASTGDEVWRFDTELPLGHSPTVVNDTLYVAGFDRRVFALNADSGALVWVFDGAKGGFSTNPLVVEGKVLLGSRDGYFYALDQNSGALVWRYPELGRPALGPVLYSAAYANGSVFFATNDNYAYALDINSGALRWRSAKLPGDGYQAWWPVVYDGFVVFSAAVSYVSDADPGTRSVIDVVDPGDPYYAQMNGFTYGQDFANRLQADDVFYQDTQSSAPLGATFVAGGLGDSTGITWAWPAGSTVVDGSKVTEYLENDGQKQINRSTHKPWRRTLIVLNTADGAELMFDSDHDSLPETAPFLYVGTKSGNRYPPLVIPTSNDQGSVSDVLYAQNLETYQSGWGIGRAILTGWQVGTQYLWSVGKSFAIDEPFANSSGGSIVYANLCCDREGIWFDLDTPTDHHGLWGYNLENALAPDYDVMWWDAGLQNYYPRLYGAYGTTNGIYHNHGLQNPIIPYQGRLFVHRSNAILAFGPNSTTPSNAQRPLLPIGDPDILTTSTLTVQDVQELLDAQIARMLQKGHLRPGYYNSMRNMVELANYFENPGDTLYTLVRAYPLVSDSLKPDLERYIKQHFQMYFADELIARTGYWRLGAPPYNLNDPEGFGQLQPREWMEAPPEVALDMQEHQPDFWPGVNWPWDYPQHNIYAMWRYAQLFHAGDSATLQTIYALAKSRLHQNAPGTDTLIQKPWSHNAYIAGYLGFLELQELAGKTQEDGALHAQIESELNRLLELRTNDFRKDHPWVEDLSRPCCKTDLNRRVLNIARNFMNMTPELGAYLRNHAFDTVHAAIEEYEQVAPYWFATRYEASFGELASDNLYTTPGLFQAKALILQEPTEQLLKYVDMPAFETGDLFYIQNLVAVLTDPPPGIRLSVSSSPATVEPGGSATITVQVQAVGGYSGEVTLTMSSSSPDVRVQPATAVVSVPDEVMLNVDDLVAEGASAAGRSYVITIVAAGEGIEQTTRIMFRVLGEQDNTIWLPTVPRIDASTSGIQSQFLAPTSRNTLDASSVRRLNAPYFDGPITLNEMGIAWFGQVTMQDNYVDTRVGYNDKSVLVDLAAFDRHLWYDETPSAADLGAWDTGVLFLNLDGNQGAEPGPAAYRFEGQLGGGKAAYQGDDSSWIESAVPFSITLGWRGDGMNGGQEAKGWRVIFEIPFESLGLSGPPTLGASWGIGLVVRDRDDAADSPVPDQVWPEAIDSKQPQTWGQLHFGLPVYVAPNTTPQGTTTLRHGLNGVQVSDAHVGGHTICGGTSSYFDNWGNNNYAGYAQINIQNQADISDWPCFSKYYVTFPLDTLPAGKSVISATLTMYLFGNAGQNPEPGWAPGDPEPSWIQVLTVAEDWDESTITWNNAPLPVENIAGVRVDPIEFFHPGIPYTWDVSRAVTQAYATSQPLRLALYMAPEGYHSGKYFWSSDADEAVRPLLQVAWGESTDNPHDDPDKTDDSRVWLPLLTR